MFWGRGGGLREGAYSKIVAFLFFFFLFFLEGGGGGGEELREGGFNNRAFTARGNTWFNCSMYR